MAGNSVKWTQLEADLAAAKEAFRAEAEQASSSDRTLTSPVLSVKDAPEAVRKTQQEITTSPLQPREPRPKWSPQLMAAVRGFYTATSKFKRVFQKSRTQEDWDRLEVDARIMQRGMVERGSEIQIVAKL